MAQPSAQEQYLLELINRFRTNPAAEYDLLVNSDDADVNGALGFFGTDLALLTNQWNSLSAAQPLVWSDQLGDSSATHNQLMINADQQSHNLPGEPTLINRINNAGSNSYNAVAENLYAFSESPFFAHAGLTIDWGDDDGDDTNGFGTGIQNLPGHRNTLISTNYREVGISIIAESDPETAVGPLSVTQHFGNRSTGTNRWLTGVAFRDFDDDDFYSVGEGLDDVTVNISNGTFNTAIQTGLAGGYQTLVPQGTYTVSFEQNGATFKIFDSVVVGNQSVKRDAFLDVGIAPTAGLGKITGIQFDDANGNGIKDLGESGLANRQVFLDLNQNGQLDSSDTVTTTNAAGVYVFNNVASGTYSVRPDIAAGREQTLLPTLPLGSEFYQLDDGEHDGFSVLSSSGDDALIFNQFETQGGPKTLTSISIGLSPVLSNYPGLKNATKLFIYQDANNDNRPDGGEKIREIDVALTGQGGFANVAIAPTVVDGTFFVGALYEGVSAEYTLAPIDSTAPAGNSWQAISSDPTSFSASAVSGANWLLRANDDGVQGQVVRVQPDQTVGGVRFSDRATALNVINGTAGAETIGGTSGNDDIKGFAGNDVIRGFGGQDVIDGGAGSDNIFGNAGADTLIGGANTDFLNYSDSTAAVTVTLSSAFPSQGGSAEGDTNSGFENLVGSNFDDVLVGDSGHNVLRGGLGNDNLSSGAGNDTVFGGAGADTMNGGSDIDFLNYIESSAAVAVTLGSGVGVGGDAAGDTNVGFERLIGSNFGDTLIGDDIGNILQGRAGNDTLSGKGGNDILIGGGGRDTLTGGDGLDAFRFFSIAEGVDTITDFRNDVIQVRGVNFGGGLTNGLLDTSQLVIGAAATTANHRFVYNNGALFFDVDGTGTANQVLLANVSNGAIAASINANNIQVI